MTTPNKSKVGPTKVGETQKSADALAVSYRDHMADPKCKRKFDLFGVDLSERLEQFLPDGFSYGSLKSQDADIRQEAAKLLLTSYLSGNSDLRMALRGGVISDIADQLDRSLQGAIKAVTSSLLRANEVRIRHHQRVIETCMEWSSCDEKSNASKNALREAGLEDLLLSTRDTEIIRQFLAGRSRKEICEEQGLSPSGLSRVLKRVTKIALKRNTTLPGINL